MGLNGVVRAVDPRPQPHGRRRAAGAQARARSRRPRPLPGLPSGESLRSGHAAGDGSGVRRRGGRRKSRPGSRRRRSRRALRRAPRSSSRPRGPPRPAPPPLRPRPTHSRGRPRGCRLPRVDMALDPAGKAREAGARSRGACRGRGGLGGATPRPPRPPASRPAGARRRGGGGGPTGRAGERLPSACRLAAFLFGPLGSQAPLSSCGPT